MSDKRMILGVDPGAVGTGAFAVIDLTRKTKHYWKFPGSAELDYEALLRAFRKLQPNILIAGIEWNQAVAGQTKASSTTQYKYGWNNGMIWGILKALDFPLIEVNPRKWQNAIYKPFSFKKGLTTKEKALHATSRLFPGEKFLPTPRSTTPHDGCIDALLIAEYVRRVHYGEERV